jgi:excisionase family DNA binding protein
MAELPVDVLESVARRAAELALSEAGAVGADGWLDVDQAAEYLACKPHRVYDLVGEGRLRCEKDGRRSLFRREWLDAGLENGGAGR